MIDNNFQTHHLNNIFNHREYNIMNENNEYNLRIEIDKQYIYFIVSKLNDSLNYNHKNKLDLLTIINKLELNASKFSNLELILKIFDRVYQKNKLDIKINDDNSINLLIKLLNVFEEETINEIKLYKDNMNNNDKFNFLFNQLKFIKNISAKDGEHEKKDEFQNKLNEMNNNISKKEEEIKEIKDILNKKEEMIKEMNEKILNKENIIEIINESINKKLKNSIEEIETKFILILII